MTQMLLSLADSGRNLRCASFLLLLLLVVEVLLLADEEGVELLLLALAPYTCERSQ
jgi:hypothetical protein